eukprot:TRINITY_DN585_c0_g1_i2.p1 TRINITY_DN585_c0_g1~~TRINITY_DN585_c0_g1_i2.p1  ORF type:complete len:284 (+),score=37.67 TRINITY_DN585_c0_g1_i2:840-1691(+)
MIEANINFDKTAALFWSLRKQKHTQHGGVAKLIRRMPKDSLELEENGETTLMAALSATTISLKFFKWLLKQVPKEYALRIAENGSILSYALRNSHHQVCKFLMDSFPELVPKLDQKGVSNFEHCLSNRKSLEETLVVCFKSVTKDIILQSSWTMIDFLMRLTAYPAVYPAFVKLMGDHIEEDDLSRYFRHRFDLSSMILANREFLWKKDETNTFLQDFFLGVEQKKLLQNYIVNLFPDIYAQFISIVGCQDYVDHEYALYNAEGCIQDAFKWMTLPYEMPPSL